MSPAYCLRNKNEIKTSYVCFYETLLLCKNKCLGARKGSGIRIYLFGFASKLNTDPDPSFWIWIRIQTKYGSGALINLESAKLLTMNNY